MLNQTFEEFLQEVHINLFPQILDDDLPDHFDNWLGEIESEEYIKWAELYGKEQFLKGRQQTIDNLKL